MLTIFITTLEVYNNTASTSVLTNKENEGKNNLRILYFYLIKRRLQNELIRDFYQSLQANYGISIT